MSWRQFIAVAAAVAVGIVLGGLVLAATGIVGQSDDDSLADYQRCKDALSPWQDPAEEC